MKQMMNVFVSLVVVQSVVLFAHAQNQPQKPAPTQMVNSRALTFDQPMFPGMIFLLKQATIPDLKPLEKVVGGRLIVGARSIDLDVKIVLSCPPNAYCVAYVPNHVTARLPIVKREMSNCGDRYTAQLDMMPVDGMLQKIEFTDYSRATCELPLTSIARATYTVSFYNRINGKLVTKQSEFTFDHAR